jgi:uncharacterized membrane protein YbhN (UPF0104 family)
VRPFINQTSRTQYLKILQWAVVTTIFIFLGKMVWQNWAQVKEASFTLEPYTLLLATLSYGGAFFIQVWAWYLITVKLGIALPGFETLESWFYSQLGKYLPGKVWLLLSRFYFYESKAKSRKSIWIALYVETATMVIAAWLLFLAGLFLFQEVRTFYSAGKWIGWMLPFLLAFLSLHPRVLQRIFNWILTFLKKDTVSLPISYTDILWILLISVLSWAVGGVGFYFFVKSLYPVSLSHVLFLAGSLSFASLLGLIALFAPIGLGVREGILVYFLSYLMPSSVAVVISILTRLWMTFIEIGLIGMIYLVGKFRKGFGKRRDERTERE